jgi:hypothetical protein
MIARSLLLACGLLVLPLLPASAQHVVAAGGVKLNLGQDGSVVGLSLGEKPWRLAKPAASGLLFRDVAAGGQFVAAGGAITPTAGGLKQAGTNAPLRLDFAATYRARPGAIEVKGFVHDRSAQDRAITVRFALPVAAAGGTWWQDLLNHETIANGVYANLHNTGVGATGNTSAFPWGAISSAAGELCLGVPMDRFVVHRIAYDGQAESFALDFDFGPSPLTKAFPSRADFSFVIYAADPRWGFRSATSAYYALFPDAFRRRAAKEGLWMPFADIARVQDPEDFNFAFQEGASNIAWDEVHGIYSFRYISPHWAWLWMPERQDKPTPEFVQQRLAADLKSDNPATRQAAELIVSCAARNAQGEYQYSIGQAHWAPHQTGYLGWYAMYPANADPDLAQLGKGPTTGSQTMASVERDVATYAKPGAFLDGFYFDGVDERPLDNYATEQFPFAEAPLTFGTDTRRPILCGAFSSYKFLRRVAEKMWASKRLTMANGIPSQFPFSLYYLDAGGSEQEPSIESAPVDLSYLTYARALMHHKPLLLLYKPRLDERFDRDLSPYLVDYMNACLPYAAEPSLFMIFSNTDPSFYYNFWERPDWYNRYRSIFVDYAPLVKRLALAGWEPVTNARASVPGIVVERFGNANLHLVAYNPAREGEPVSFDLDVEQPALPGRSLACAVNLVDGTAVPTTRRPGGGVRVHLTLAPRRAAVLAFAPRGRQLAGFDLAEAARYGGIAESRLQDKLHPGNVTNFEDDPGDTGTPRGFSPYTEGQAAFASDTKVFHSAPRATRVTLTGRARAVQSVSLPVPAGRNIHFSLWGKADFPTPGSLDFYVRWQDKDGTSIGEAINSPAMSQTGDWQQLTLDATAPESATTATMALVATRQGDGVATAWFDDPGIAVLEDSGQPTVLLPVPPVVPPPAADQLATALQQRSAQLQRLTTEAPGANGAAVLCGQALNLAGQLTQQAQTVRQDTPDYAGVAAALDVSAWRLRRAGGILAGWQMALTGGGEVAQGERAQFQVRIQAGPAPLKGVRVSLDNGSGPAPAPFKLASNEARTLKFGVVAPGATGTGGRVTAVAHAQTAAGQTLELQREAPYRVVSPCETALRDQGPGEGGREQRLLLVVRNMRRAVPLTVRVAVSAAQGFSSSVSDQAAEIKPRGELRLPIVLAAGPNEQPGWRETTVKVTWEGGEQVHQQAQLYLPASANLLRNPGFEEGQGALATGWSPYGKGGYAVDAQVHHTGRQAIRVSGADAGAMQTVVLNQQVPRPLVLRGWSLHEKPAGQAERVMTIGQTEQAPAASGTRSPNYALYADLHYVGGGGLNGQVATFDRVAAGWQFAEKIINVAKPVKDATVYLLHRGRPGTAWFDEVFLAESSPDLALWPGVKVTADSASSGYTTAPLTDAVTDTEAVPWDQAAWASEDARGGHWVELAFPQEVTMKTVVLYWAVDAGSTWTSRNYAIQAFVDGAWREVATATAQNQRDLSVHSFAPVKTSRLRLLQPEGGGNAARPNILWLREIAVF